MPERRNTGAELAVIKTKLESIDARAKSVVAGEEAIQTALSNMGEKSERYLSDISYGLEAGLQGLAAAFEWGMAEIVYHLELQNEELQKIVEILEAPLETQAKELRRRAEFAHSNGWIDEALADFLEAGKKNYADFTIHQSLGNIYLGKNDLIKAQEYFEKAAKYARPHSSYYTAYALWHLARVKYQQGDISAAYEATREATRLQTDLVQALYDHARHCALLMKQDESMSSLRQAIEIDRNYSLKALTDDSFTKVAQAVGILLETLRQEAKQRAQKALADCYECLRLAADKEFEELEPYRSRTYCDGLEAEMRNVETLIKKGGYFELPEAEKLGSNARDSFVHDFMHGPVLSLEGRIDRVSQEMYYANKELEKGPDFNLFGGWFWTFAIFSPSPLIALFLGILGRNNLLAIPLGMVSAILLGLLISILARDVKRAKHSSTYQPIVQSKLDELQILHKDLSQLNGLFERFMRGFPKQK